jgi:hydroxyacylglutathione hydrolase
MNSEILTISLGFVNCYLVKTDAGFILVDTGMRSGRANLEKALISAGCQPGNLKLMIITHGDIDHTDNCVYLREKYQTRIVMHRNDANMVENGSMQPKRKVKSSLLRLMHLVMRLSGGMNKMVAAFDRFKPDFFLDEGQSLMEYGFDATVLHLPGHTKGSIAILTNNGDLISGDTLENRGGLHPALIVDDEAELAASVDRLARLGLKTVYPGHGKPFTWEQFVEHYLTKNRAAIGRK